GNSAPTAAKDQIAEGNTLDGSWITIQGIQYTFKNSWSSVTSGQCFIKIGSSTATVSSELASAITNNGSPYGVASSTSTWQCNGASQPTNGVTVTSTVNSSTTSFQVTAKIAGSTGVTITPST